MAVSLHFFGESGVWGRVAVIVRDGVKGPIVMVDFSCGVRVFMMRSSGGVSGDFVSRVQSVERERDWVVFVVES